MKSQKKITQILYSGLGGTGNVFFSIVGGDQHGLAQHGALFYGIEPVIDEYREKCESLGIQYESIVKNRGLDFKSLRKIYTYLSKEKPDALILHNPGLILVCFIYGLFRKCRTIVVEHQTNQAKTNVNWIGSILSLIFSNKLVLLTDLYLKEYQQKFGFFLPSRKITVINNGIPIPSSETKPSIDSSDIRIGMASRLNDLRDHKTLLGAVHALATNNPSRQYNLLIAGDGPTMDALKSYSQKLHHANCRISFLGMLNEDKLSEFFESLDIYVHSSLGETMSTSIMQAMSYGLPIIATDIPGINNMIEHEVNGLLFKVYDHNSLKELLERFIKDTEQAQKLSRNARSYARSNFSQERMFNAYFNLIHKK